ncbi:MAG: nitrous oxide reductase accessory protein NosL [Geobacteraceae bacterium]|nr:nitrous oxide reductase accessory protein NosL [Geobacteraceae bacterium]
MKLLSKLAVMLLLAALPLSSAVMAVAKGDQAPSAKDKCPVCGMFVAKYPEWTASVTIENGSRLYFDGVKDMFSFLQQPEKYLSGKAKSTITAVTVKDYYSLKNINGKDAFFVTGSDIKGPMGAELIPFATKKDADGFMKDHRGKRVFRFGEVTMKVLKEL